MNLLAGSKRLELTVLSFSKYEEHNYSFIMTLSIT